MQQLIDIRRETPEELALQAMIRLLEREHPLVVLFSAGKDSSVLANLAATAAARVVATGRRALIVLAHADVLVENPEIARLAKHEIGKYRRFCEARGIDVVARVSRARPSGTRSPFACWAAGPCPRFRIRAATARPIGNVWPTPGSLPRCGANWPGRTGASPC